MLKFSTFGGPGDPRENKNWDFDFIGHSLSQHQQCREHHSKAPSIFNKFIKERCKTLSFCEWNNEDNDEFKRMNSGKNPISPYLQVIHRTSFARSRMWTQYAGNHTGVCLVFSKDKITEQFLQLQSTFKQAQKFAKSVEYMYHRWDFNTSRKISIADIFKFDTYPALYKHLNRFHHELFFLKNMDYRDEHEYRLVMTSEKSEDNIWLPIYSSLEAVIVGIDFPKKDCAEITELAQDAAIMYN